jgi:signal transduction histidine kinase
VARYQDGRLSPPILKQRVTSLLRAADGTVWFGGAKTLWRERQGQLESLTPPGPDRDTQALALDKSGDLWASIVRSGVFRLKDGVWTPFGGIDALPRETAITIVRDRRDRLWFSYAGGSVAVLDGEQVRIYGAKDGLQIGNVMANHPGRIGHWLGGEFGLARFDGERFYSVRSAPELPLDGITGIVETKDGDLWLNGRPGIVHIAAIELEKSRLDPAYRVHGESLGAFDGIVGSAAMVRPLPTAIEAGDGKLWFATDTGIYGIDPARRVHNQMPPPVSIRTLTVGGQTFDPVSGLTLPVRTNAVRFDYAGLSLTAAEKVRYRYRLDGVDTDWRELTAARQALYTNLRPGHYTFHVIAANNDGVWNEQGASLAFIIPPAFVQTGWFIALCVAGGAAAVWALVRLRVRRAAVRVRRRLEERMAERERIARELHDTLLQGVQGLLLRFQVAADRIPKGEPAREMMDRALERADQVLDEGRERVKALRAPVGGAPELPQALARIVEELAPADASPFRITVEGSVRELEPIVREEVQMIAREALTNAYRHATAGKIEAEIAYGDDALTVRIRDDGKGIDGEVLREGRPGHFGLLGMRERAKRLRAHLRIWSRPGAGTEVELRIPAAIAYRQAARRSWRPWWRRTPALDVEDPAL